MKQWEEYGPEKYEIKRPIFFGMKSCVRKKTDGTYSRDRHDTGSIMNYGTWTEQTVKITYDALPKRPYRNDNFTLNTWAMAMDCISMPYPPALGQKEILSPLAQQLRDESILRSEQPDKDEVDTEFET